MARNTNHSGHLLTIADRQQANKFIFRFLQSTMNDGKDEIVSLRKKLTITYWVVIGLSVVMFILGIALLSVPLMAAWRAEIDVLRSLIAAGFGIADLAALFLFRPVERIYDLMGDFSQITLTLNSYQTQVALRLKEMNGADRPSIGRAADHIGNAALNSTRLVQTYFEEREALEPH
jgi:hypothetical protein